MSRTFKLEKPLMEGSDIEQWQRFIKSTFDKWNIDYPIVVDDVYGVGARSATASLLYCLGINHVEAMKQGVTPELRIKVRHRRLTASERTRFLTTRVAHRAKLRRKYNKKSRVASPLHHIIQSSWGWAPGHDGVDLICDARAPGFAICNGVIRRADAGGWWGKGAPSPAVAARGDGIVILECTVNVGPFRKGMCFGYGHAEAPVVRVGDTVKAGERICEAGMANAWHFHFMCNGGGFAKTQGRGDRDPMPFVRYAIKHS